MPEKKGATQIVEVTLYESRELNHGSEFQNKSPSLNQGDDEGVADGLSDNSSRLTKMDFHNYVNKEITFVRSNGIMMYVRGKHTKLNIG